MNTTYMAPVGDRGRVVLPAKLRESQHWAPGTALLFVETEGGVIVTTPRRALDTLRDQLGGSDIVASLLEERRAAAAAEDEL